MPIVFAYVADPVGAGFAESLARPGGNATGFIQFDYGLSAKWQVLSDLLWAAFGVNRPSGDRTAPYWRHIMVIDVYVATADGLWLYEPQEHSLLLQFRADIRTHTGLQDFVGTAPLNLIYVAHGERMQGISPQERRLYAMRWQRTIGILAGRSAKSERFD